MLCIHMWWIHDTRYRISRLDQYLLEAKWDIDVAMLISVYLTKYTSL